MEGLTFYTESDLKRFLSQYSNEIELYEQEEDELGIWWVNVKIRPEVEDEKREEMAREYYYVFNNF